jgi:hypothetical protein
MGGLQKWLEMAMRRDQMGSDDDLWRFARKNGWVAMVINRDIREVGGGGGGREVG